MLNVLVLYYSDDVSSFSVVKCQCIFNLSCWETCAPLILECEWTKRKIIQTLWKENNYGLQSHYRHHFKKKE
jgi:hypothetical protein